jgi:hypothetical protein
MNPLLYSRTNQPVSSASSHTCGSTGTYTDRHTGQAHTRTGTQDRHTHTDRHIDSHTHGQAYRIGTKAGTLDRLSGQAHRTGAFNRHTRQATKER